MGLLAVVIAQARDLVPRGQLRAGIAGRLFPLFFLIIGIIYIYIFIYIYILEMLYLIYSYIFIYMYIYIVLNIIYIYIYILCNNRFWPIPIQVWYNYDVPLYSLCLHDPNTWSGAKSMGFILNYITNMENEPTNIAYTNHYAPVLHRFVKYQHIKNDQSKCLVLWNSDSTTNCWQCVLVFFWILLQFQQPSNDWRVYL